MAHGLGAIPVTLGLPVWVVIVTMVVMVTAVTTVVVAMPAEKIVKNAHFCASCSLLRDK
jgi:hypothetical protein